MNRAATTSTMRDEPSLSDDERSLRKVLHHAETRRSRRHGFRALGFSVRTTLAVAIVGCASVARPLQTETIYDAAASLRQGLAVPPSRQLGRRDLDSVDGSVVADAVRQLRPEWLRSRLLRDGSRVAPVVFIDDRYIGSIDELGRVSLAAARSVEFLEPSRAWDRFGSACRCAAGVIFVFVQSSAR